jgi:hypothetical protein
VTDFKVRASSWGTLFDCPMRWEGIHLLKMRSPSSMRAALGTAIHAGTAAYDQSRMDGTGMNVMDAAGVLVDSLHNPREEIDYKADDLTIKEAESIGLTLHGRYCSTISPRYEFVAVELTTKPLEIDCGNGITVTLTGTMDRCRALKTEYGVSIADVKTGMRATLFDKDAGIVVAATKGHAPQLGTYELLYEHTTGEPVTGPAEIIGMNTGKPAIAVAQIPNPRRVLVGTDESPGLIQFAAEMFRSGMFPPNPQSRLCAKKYCPRWGSCIHHD